MDWLGYSIDGCVGYKKSNNKVYKMDKVEKMKCKECLQERVKTSSGICVLCSADPKGIEIRDATNKNTHGKEIKSKTGNSKCAENTWMAQK